MTDAAIKLHPKGEGRWTAKERYEGIAGTVTVPVPLETLADIVTFMRQGGVGK